MRSKQILTYIVWTTMAILISFCYVHLLLGSVPDEETYGSFWFIAQLFYGYGLLHVGIAIGSIVAILFILTDIFYLKKRLQNKSKKTIVRLMVMAFLMVVVAIIHYILEKVIDII